METVLDSPWSIAVSVKVLKDLASPFDSCIWLGLSSPITRKEVREALAANAEEANPVYENAPRQQHIQRVAFLVRHGWPDPIQLDACPTSLIYDGYHRLAAAIYRKDKTIPAQIYGDLDIIRETFGEVIAKQVEAAWDAEDLNDPA